MDAAARAELARKLFKHVFATVCEFVAPRTIIIVSRAPEVLHWARADGGVALTETSQPDLNAALAQAANFARETGASKILVVAGDLPLLCASDLAEMTAADCAVAPDRHRRGTNALVWPAIPAPRFHFGENSFERHLAIARTAGLDPRIVSRPGLAHDVDVPEDLLELPG
jgi:2-phospho-L-lactate guanylyltransferase